MKNSLSDGSMVLLTPGKSYILTLMKSGEFRKCIYEETTIVSGELTLGFRFEGEPFTVGLDRLEGLISINDGHIAFGQDAPIKITPIPD